MPPKKIVAELDRYIVGQEARRRPSRSRCVNRWRRSQAPEEIRDEIMPNNIIMIGPTGVGENRDRAPSTRRRGPRSRLR